MSAIGTDLKAIEEKAVEEIRKVMSDAAANQPAIEDAVVEALGLAGAPGSVATAVGAALGALLSHFRSQQPPAPDVATSDSVATSNTEAPPVPDAVPPAQELPPLPQASPTWSQAVAGVPPTS